MSGRMEWSYRRFILHYAHLCAPAGGVEAFCIGSEMRALTQMRGPGTELSGGRALWRWRARCVRSWGRTCKIGYAADWSEYFGYHPQDGSGDVCFHLDPLWSDPEIDFIGIDNYMPLSDWRDGCDHADAGWGSIYDLDYLRANIAGGEGYDWYYHTPEAEAVQLRTPITRRRLRRALGLSLQGYPGLVVQSAPHAAGRGGQQSGYRSTGRCPGLTWSGREPLLRTVIRLTTPAIRQRVLK